jgi:hypothetical protein
MTALALGGVGSALAEEGVAGSELAEEGVAGSELGEEGVAGSELAEGGVRPPTGAQLQAEIGDCVAGLDTDPASWTWDNAAQALG